MKFEPGQNRIVSRQGLSSTTYIKDTPRVQIVPEPEQPKEEVKKEISTPKPRTTKKKK